MSELPNIIVTRHAMQQYKERILVNEPSNAGGTGNKHIMRQVKELFAQARYVSDNDNGILFRDKQYMIEFIVRNGRVITIYPINKRKSNGKDCKNDR